VPPAALSASPNRASLLQALRRRWRLALALGAFVAAAAAVGMWAMRPISFTARTLVHIAPTPRRVLFPPAGEGQGDFGNFQRAQVALIRSRLVLVRALRDPKVAALPTILAQPDPVTWLEDNVRADFSIAPENLKISITGPEGGDLKTLVAAVRDAYLSEIVNRERNARLKRLDRLKKLCAEDDRALQEKRARLKNDPGNLKWLQDEIAQMEAVTKEVARQKQALEVEIDAEDRVTLLEEEVVAPAQPASSRFRMAALAAIAGFGAVLLGVALLEFRACRVGSADEITHGLKLSSERGRESLCSW
jgi:uncharacterized protein involved in exopolysaccharide biosynthesis